MHVQSCSFTNTNLSLFCRSRCRRHRSCLSSLLLSSQKWATMVTCRHSSPLYCKLFQVRFTDFCAQIVQINEHKSEPAHFALNTISLLLSLSRSSTIQLFRSFSIFSFFLHHHHNSIVFPPDHHIKGNGYTLSMQQLQGSFGRTSVTYDWLMVALNTIDHIITNACPRQQKKKKKEKLSLYIDRFPQLKPLCLLPRTEPLISL